MSFVQLVQFITLLVVVLACFIIPWIIKKRIDKRIDSFAEKISTKVCSYMEKKGEDERNVRLDAFLKRFEGMLADTEKKTEKHTSS